MVIALIVGAFVVIIGGRLLLAKATGAAASSINRKVQPRAHQLGQELTSAPVTWESAKPGSVVLAQVTELTGDATFAPNGSLTLQHSTGTELVLAWANKFSTHWRAGVLVTDLASGSRVIWTPIDWKTADGMVVALKQMKATRDKVQEIATGE